MYKNRKTLKASINKTPLYRHPFVVGPYCLPGSSICHRALKLMHNGRGESALLFGRIVSLSINLHWTTVLKYPRQCGSASPPLPPPDSDVRAHQTTQLWIIFNINNLHDINAFHRKCSEPTNPISSDQPKLNIQYRNYPISLFRR